MSYVRFSTDDYQSDVYAYESVHNCYCLHVATRRYVFKEPLPPKVNFRDDKDAWFKRYEKICELVDSADHELIDHDEAGDSYYFETLQELYDKIKELEKKGFRVPNCAFRAMEEELNNEL